MNSFERSIKGIGRRLACLGLLIGMGAAQASPIPLQEVGGDRLKQLLERGYTENGVFDGDDESSVNLFNGNLVLSIPIGMRYPVSSALSYQLKLVYNANQWDYYHALGFWSLAPSATPAMVGTAVPHRGANAGLGWQLSLGRLYEPFGFGGDAQFSAEAQAYPNQGRQWMYVSADGSQHLFAESLSPSVSEAGGAQYSRDGSYLRLREVDGRRLVEFPNGVTHVFEHRPGLTLRDRWRLSRIHDAFGSATGSQGNYLDIAYEGDNWRLTDSTGRSHLLVFEADPHEGPARLKEARMAAFSGGGPDPDARAVYGFSYRSQTYVRPSPPSVPPALKFRLADPEISRTVAVSTLAGITLPAGAGSYGFDYQPETDTSIFAAGKLTGMQTPLGAYHAWKYGLYVMPAVSCPDDPPEDSGDSGVAGFTRPTVGQGVVEKTVYASRAAHADHLAGGGTAADRATWTYTFEHQDVALASRPADMCMNVARQFTNSVRAPDGSVTVNYFNGYQEQTFWDNAPADLARPDAKWRNVDFGLGFTPNVERAGLHVQNRPAQTLHLGSEIYDCASTRPIPLLPHRPEAVRGCPRLRASYVAYETDPVTLGEPCVDADQAQVSCAETNRRLAGSAVEHYDAPEGANASRTAVTFERSLDFDGLGNFRTRYAGWTEPASGRVRYFTGFNPGRANPLAPAPAGERWLLNLYDRKSTVERGQTVRVDYVFDEQTGFLRRTRAVASLSGQPAPGDVAIEHTADVWGNTLSTVHYRMPAGPDAFTETTSLGAAEYGKRADFDAASAGTPRSTDWLAVRTVANPANAPVLQPISTNEVDTNTGLVAGSTGVDGVTEVFDYDALGRRTDYTVSGLQPLRIEYCTAGAVPSHSGSACDSTWVKVTVGAGGSIFAQSKTTFDSLGRARERERTGAHATGTGADGRPTVATQAERMRMRYDAMGRLAMQTAWGADPSETADTRTFRYDALGRTIRETLADGSTVVTDRYGEHTTLVTRSVLTERGDAQRNAVKTVRRDGLGRVRELYEQAQPTLADGERQAARATYEYDAGGKLRRVLVSNQVFPIDPIRAAAGSEPIMSATDGVVVDEGDTAPAPGTQERLYSYDALGRSLSTVIPELPGVTRLVQDYDSLGLPGTVTWSGAATPRQWRFIYDAMGRPTQVFDDSPSTPRLMYEAMYADGPDAHGHTAQIGKPIRVKRRNHLPLLGGQALPVDVIVSERYAYEHPAALLTDHEVSIARIQRTDGLRMGADQAFATHYDYDPVGNLEAIDYPDCEHAKCPAGALPDRRLEYFDFVDKLFAVRETVDGSVAQVSATFDYHPDGMLKTIEHRAGDSVLAVESLDRDCERNAQNQTVCGDPNRLGSIAVARGATTLWNSGRLRYDGSGHLVSAGADTYRYDEAGRLASASVNGRMQSFSYDVFGNQTGRVTEGSVRTLPVDAASNRSTAPGVLYGAFGNVTQIEGLVASYDSTDRMTSLKMGAGPTSPRLHYYYNVNDERVGVIDERDGSERLTLRGPGGAVLRELNADGGAVLWKRDYLQVGSRRLGVVSPKPGGEHRVRYHHDFVGNLRVVSNEDGTQPERFDYFPFGEVADRSGPVDSAARHLFTGHERDRNGAADSDDLDYMMARYYAPHFARFLSLDPVIGDVSSLVTWNLYQYVRNNPVNLWDPEGRTEEAAFAAGVALAYGRKEQEMIREAYKNSPMAAEIDRGMASGDGLSESAAEVREAVERGEIKLTPGGVLKAAGMVLLRVKAPRVNLLSRKAMPGGARGGMPATRSTKKKVFEDNRAENGGENRCANCKREVAETRAEARQRGIPQGNVDHIHPRSKNGSGSLPNLEILCGDGGCNQQKGNRIPATRRSPADTGRPHGGAG